MFVEGWDNQMSLSKIAIANFTYKFIVMMLWFLISIHNRRLIHLYYTLSRYQSVYVINHNIYVYLTKINNPLNLYFWYKFLLVWWIKKDRKGGEEREDIFIYSYFFNFNLFYLDKDNIKWRDKLRLNYQLSTMICIYKITTYRLL